MKRNGFVLIEALTMFLILITALMLFYVSANTLFLKEKEHSYYDDIVSIYNGYYVKEALKEYSNLSTIVNDTIFDNYYGFVVGSEFTNNFFDTNAKLISFYDIANQLNLYQMYLTNDAKNLKLCAQNIDLDDKCRETYLDEDLRAYIKTMNTKGISSKYYMILEFRQNISGQKCNSEDCFSYYTWVAL